MGWQAFLAHRLTVEVTFFATENRFRATIKGLLPVFFFLVRLSGMKEYRYSAAPAPENANFSEYRRGVLRGKTSNEFWIMAERIIRDYTA